MSEENETQTPRNPRGYVTHDELARIRERDVLSAISTTVDELSDAVTQLREYINELESHHSD